MTGRDIVPRRRELEYPGVQLPDGWRRCRRCACRNASGVVLRSRATSRCCARASAELPGPRADPLPPLDNLQETPAKPDPSGRAMIDGPAVAADLDKVAAHKKLVAASNSRPATRQASRAVERALMATLKLLGPLLPIATALPGAAPSPRPGTLVATSDHLD